MVDFISRNIKSTLQAILTKRVLGNIQLTDFTPPPTVNLVVVGRPLSSIILTSGDGFVSRTVLSLTNKLGATRIFTGFKGFLWFVVHGE